MRKKREMAHPNPPVDEIWVTMNVTSILKQNPNTTCVICLDKYEETETILGLACGHHFHDTCIQTARNWSLARTGFWSCPICRQEFYVETGFGTDEPMGIGNSSGTEEIEEFINDSDEDYENEIWTNPLDPPYRPLQYSVGTQAPNYGGWQADEIQRERQQERDERRAEMEFYANQARLLAQNYDQMAGEDVMTSLVETAVGRLNLGTTAPEQVVSAAPPEQVICQECGDNKPPQGQCETCSWLAVFLAQQNS